MTNSNLISIVPSDQTAREDLVKGLNEYIKLEEIIESSKEAMKNIVTSQYEKHSEQFSEPLKKGKFSKQFKLVVKEHLAAKASEAIQENDEAIGAYEVIKNKLI